MLRHAFRESTLASVLTQARENLQTVVADSRLLSVSRETLGADDTDRAEGARPSRGFRNGSRLLGVVVHSILYRWLARIPRAIQRASPNSNLSGLARISRRFVTHSWLYRWLTAEPDPDVIVIDLRETLTVGPWLVALERGLRWLLPAAATSVLFGAARRCQTEIRSRPVQLVSRLVGLIAALLLVASAGTGVGSTILVGGLMMLALLAFAGSRITWSWADLQETRGYRALAAAFEPPEPPEHVCDDSDTPDSEDDQPQSKSSERE